jgi:hypothetical protein
MADDARKALAIPAERLAEVNKVFADADRWAARMRRRYPPPRKLPEQCALARKQCGIKTRDAIARLWQLSRLPERERAAAIATRLSLSERHVRRVIRAAGK